MHFYPLLFVVATIVVTMIYFKNKLKQKVLAQELIEKGCLDAAFELEIPLSDSKLQEIKQIMTDSIGKRCYTGYIGDAEIKISAKSIYITDELTEVNRKIILQKMIGRYEQIPLIYKAMEGM